MLGQTLPGNVFPRRTGTAVIAVGIDADAAARQEFPPDFDILRIHGIDEVVHDDVDAVFVEVSVVAEAEQVEFQSLAFDHPFIGDVGNINRSVVRLTGHGTEAGEFRAVKLDEVVPVGMFVDEGFQKVRIVVCRIGRVLIAKEGNALKVFMISTHIITPFLRRSADEAPE